MFKLISSRDIVDNRLYVCVLISWLQVVEKLIRGLAMEESKNLFSLFEHNSFTDRALESRVIVADVLAKFERCLVNNISKFNSVYVQQKSI